MSFFEGHDFFGESTAHLARLINNINTGIWEYNTTTKKAKWSDGFYAILGYHPGEIECSYHNFFENILYYHDKQIFIKATHYAGKGPAPIAQIRLLTKNNGYQWFESSALKHDDDDGQFIYGVLNNINKYKLAEFTAAQADFLSAETSRIARIGGWEIDVTSMALNMSREIYNIYELHGDVKLNVDEAISFFEPAYRPVLTKAIEDAVKYCKPYDLEVLFKTAKNNTIWVRAKGIPIIDDFGKCVTVRGVFQDIDIIKRSGISMQSSINLLDDQNKRLQNFAYIVSHNLRSHAGNLKFMVNLFEETKAENDKEEIFSHIKTISESLSATMGHLDEIVKIQSEISKERKSVSFETIFNNVIATLRANIEASKAQINADFSEVPEISYIPAYLESIFQNLLTNAIKYKHPNREPVINCYTHIHEKHIYLVFEDNGMGIDMKRFGDQLFGMYRTFHQNKDAKGIGLFITRNQVEALGGNIIVDSTVDVGTKFTVRLV
ncbi:PAS domain-containing sensor histidine kinase [Mucilaginibacter gilvus]|uniref:histidine kinase n=1 Tax=Mucilaginibacter gilvus TaxID=2305909 RepID=A0A3S3W485_9SPHI|nr:PAS domain-containing sensor histidine kinase [Mucilaginibacter gilvus]RWY48030.1 PAS domain-containing protein [Mucilaginibacter gilvus]